MRTDSVLEEANIVNAEAIIMQKPVVLGLLSAFDNRFTASRTEEDMIQGQPEGKPAEVPHGYQQLGAPRGEPFLLPEYVLIRVKCTSRLHDNRI